ncbi:antifreeze protein [Roseicyclus sp. F158]|uniref:Antifreeze protein n=1 Tax=Tropicimonas omnivorans TaxID=3075590 RepID=A0ABU3DGQ6_9RHOB|nr:antifreeze protein [Roseicyclus sp. F158]MDT0682738.1 antifreeze protein [Roseicyclus sp. F158]
MPRNPAPWELATHICSAWAQSMLLAQEAQMVIAYRTLGAAGLWPVTAGENSRMVSEKGPAFTASAMAASMAAMTGKRPDEIMTAAIRPLRKETSRNAKRLSGGR